MHVMNFGGHVDGVARPDTGHRILSCSANEAHLRIEVVHQHTWLPME